MEFSIPKPDIFELLKLQLSNLFMLDEIEVSVLEQNFEQALKRCISCFAQNRNKYNFRDGHVFFNPYHSVQYMIFLYYLSNTIYRKEGTCIFLCDKIYYLNKTMNGVDIYYAVELPDSFTAEHPVGSVMGRAKYSDGFMFYQNCSVGGFHLAGGEIVYPVFGKNVRMFAGAMVLGNCNIGDDVNIGAGALIKNQDIPSGVNVFGQSPNLIMKKIR